MNSLVEELARRPDAAPRGVFLMFHASPSCVAVRADGAFGCVSTFTGALTSADPALLPRVRFLTYAEFAPDLYGSVLMASRRLLREDPAVVTRLVRALHRGVTDLQRDPDAGLEALARVAPRLDRRAERARLQATLNLEMNPALPVGSRRMPTGHVDDARLNRAIA